MSVVNIISLLGGVCLFLFGMNLMGDGLKRVAGSKLEVILYKLTSNPIKGILLGTGVTAVIQSSSATSVMVVGFVNSGMMKVKQAIGIIMGAIIGTSITGWVICLSELNGSGVFEIISTNTLTAGLAIAGIILLMFTKKETNHNIAYIMLGFAVLMFGISAMSTAVSPLRDSEEFIRLLTNFENPFIGILIGLVFTCIIQSASAAVGILQALAVTGAINFQLALPVIMGIAIGASVPVLLSALGANANGKRTALIYLLVDTLGVIVFGAIFYIVDAIVHFSFMGANMNMVSIALLNTIFRVIIVLLLSPFIGLIEKLVNIIVSDKKEDIAELHNVDRLEERFLDYPTLAIEQTSIAIKSMANLARENIEVALKLFTKFSDEGFSRVCELENIIDTYEDKIGSYLVKLTKKELSENENNKATLYLRTVTDLERISDHAKNLGESAKEISDKKIEFSGYAKTEVSTLFAALDEILANTMEAFTDDDIEKAYKVEPLEEVIDLLCKTNKANHVERVQKGICLYTDGYVYNDMLTDIERVSDHCSNIGIALRINHNELADKHGTISKQELASEHDFEKYFKEYSEMFNLK